LYATLDLCVYSPYQLVADFASRFSFLCTEVWSSSVKGKEITCRNNSLRLVSVRERKHHPLALLIGMWKTLPWVCKYCEKKRRPSTTWKIRLRCSSIRVSRCRARAFFDKAAFLSCNVALYVALMENDLSRWIASYSRYFLYSLYLYLYKSMQRR